LKNILGSGFRGNDAGDDELLYAADVRGQRWLRL